MPRSTLSRAIDVTGCIAQAPLLLSGAYSLALLAAAAAPSRKTAASREWSTSFTILVPAYDEEAGLPATLSALRALDYPEDLVTVVVIADNCSDRTAEVARSAGGASVLERTDPSARGKGQALAWGLAQLGDDIGDVVAVVDADCLVNPAFLRALDRAFGGGADVVQSDYRVGNADASPTAALRAGAFVLHNNVRPRGRERLGCSAGLLGTGMGFRRTVLRRLPWDAFGVAEDREYHYRLVDAGFRVSYVPEASVTSAMPVTRADAESQELRWEGEKGSLARMWVPRLLRAGVARHDRVRLEAGVEGLMPPQAASLLGGLLGAGLGLVTRRRSVLAPALGVLAMQATYTLAGMVVGRAPRQAFAALLYVPVMLLGRSRVLGRVAAGRTPSGWVRTARS